MKNHIANMIAKINNGQMSRKSHIFQLRKKTCEAILNVLWNEGFISGYKIQKTNSNVLKIFLKYKNNKPVITSMKLLSKPSLKMYYSLKQIWKLESNGNFLIISTSKGMMSGYECKKNKIGGEPLIKIK